MCEVCDFLTGQRTAKQAENILEAEAAASAPLSLEELKHIFENMPELTTVLEELLEDRDRFSVVCALIMLTKNEAGYVSMSEKAANNLFDKLDEYRTLIGMMGFVLGKTRQYVLNLDQ